MFLGLEYARIKIIMRMYELVFVLKGSSTEIQRKKLIATIKDWLKSVKITKQDELGQKELSYPIKKETKGVYFDWNIEAEESIPTEFERKLFTNEEVLRHLLIRTK